ncbi:hypothetical protein CEP51_009359 [Fusarium floridanum]|uniref:rRNA-processing protein FYV7 n=1 Tax=Fusarium floridanum TaxID=1325733 RepID=A0A428RHV9_9HYPO|nr:hypothetical protein CEP51_009359 [Fusarium floridanum]
MAAKRQNDAESAAPEAKKPKHGFRVGPENLPDGPWRRKVTKVKKELIHKAKVKKAYAKIKAREQQAAQESVKKPEPVPIQAPAEDVEEDAGKQPEDDANAGEEKNAEEEGEQMHPTRHLMLVDEAKAQTNAIGEETSDGNRRRTRRPGYYEKQLKKAEERRNEAEERQREFQRRREEREQKIADRQRFKKAMAKTRDRNGNKKLGRESSILLDKVRRMVADK